MNARTSICAVLLAASCAMASCAMASCAPPAARPAAEAPPAREAAGPLRAVFHLSEPGRVPNARGLTNATNALKALGDAPARIVVVVHGPAVTWLRHAEPENLGPLLAPLLATGRVEVRVCARTLEENHWTLADLVPGPTTVPSGALEVLRLQSAGYAYFRP